MRLNSNKKEFNKIAHKEYLTFDFKDIAYFGVEAKFEEDEIKKSLIKKFNVTEEQISKIKFHYDETRLVPDEG